MRKYVVGDRVTFSQLEIGEYFTYKHDYEFCMYWKEDDDHFRVRHSNENSTLHDATELKGVPLWRLTCA